MTQHSSTVVQQATCNEWTMARELAQEQNKI